MSQFRYRPNIAAIVQRHDEKILIGERLDVPGAWQFPQGGVKKSETAEQALARELKEEISLEPGAYRVIDSNGPYRYLFAKGRTKEGYSGQEQTYFLAELLGPETNIDPATEEPEFSTVRWIDPAEFQLTWVPEFKQEVYRQVFLDFFQHYL